VRRDPSAEAGVWWWDMAGSGGACVLLAQEWFCLVPVAATDGLLGGLGW
jgi:hypothetical protein